MLLCDNVKHIEGALEIQDELQGKCSQSDHLEASPRRVDMMEMVSPEPYSGLHAGAC